ncbi:hypothetical protein N8747_00020 [Candidatus Pelagibacter sp.]|nr:hypothetical protein [Candidatus Pelagibacter sp.]|tara:strand:+ start:2048 stop:2491 length:444 start_codon:yes stop_codon:yes gene_type:complete
MKKLYFLIIITVLIISDSFVKANDNISLKKYLEQRNIEEGSTQIYLLNRCSAVYAYASAIILKTDAINSKNFIEIANNLLFKSIELMVIDEKEKFENAKEKSEKKRNELFDLYISDGKKNWEQNKSHFKGSYISEDMSICANLVADK